MKNSSTIIFDLGGVLLDLHLQKSIDAFKLLMKNAETPIEIPGDFKSGVWGLPFFHQFEKGIISPADFRNEMRKTFALEATDEQIDKAWNAMLGQLPEHRVKFLVEQKKKLSFDSFDKHE